jgi:LmbE family N-acetylglucosaminyl deacetylase
MVKNRLLGVFAHPDDEGVMSGAVLRYGASGIETGLVYATRGEVGEISDPALATPENLGQVREQEMQAAADVLSVRHLWFLDYRDSGMAGTADNTNARSFVQQREADVIGKLVAIIREFRPQVMVTFDESGGYGHPDHIAIYRYTTAAYHAAADDALYPELGPAHAVSKLYYGSFPRSVVKTMAEWLGTQMDEDTSILRGTDPDTLGLPDDQIDVRLDVRQWRETKDRSWAMHRTQSNPNDLMSQLPTELRHKWEDYEYYQLATSRVGPDVPGENDLFARVV